MRARGFSYEMVYFGSPFTRAASPKLPVMIWYGSVSGLKLKSPPINTGWLTLPSISKILLAWARSEEHTSELQSLIRNSYAVFCLKKKNTYKQITYHNNQYKDNKV